jgi:hypothetical protein
MKDASHFVRPRTCIRVRLALRLPPSRLSKVWLVAQSETYRCGESMVSRSRLDRVAGPREEPTRSLRNGELASREAETKSAGTRPPPWPTFLGGGRDLVEGRLRMKPRAADSGNWRKSVLGMGRPAITASMGTLEVDPLTPFTQPVQWFRHVEGCPGSPVGRLAGRRGTK